MKPILCGLLFTLSFPSLAIGQSSAIYVCVEENILGFDRNPKDGSTKIGQFEPSTSPHIMKDNSAQKGKNYLKHPTIEVTKNGSTFEYQMEACFIASWELKAYERERLIEQNQACIAAYESNNYQPSRFLNLSTSYSFFGGNPAK